MLKKVFKSLAILLGGIIIALALLPFVFEDEIKEGFKQALNDQINATVDFDDVNLSFFKSFPNACLNVDNLSVNGIAEFDGTALLNAESIELSISIPSIINKATPYVVNSAQFNNVNLNLKIDSLGRSNYLIMKESEQEAKFIISIEEYKVEEGNIFYQNNLNNQLISIQELNHQGKGRFTQDLFDLTTKTTSKKFNYSINGIPILVNAEANADAIIEINLPEEKYTFRENDITINSLDVKLDGYLQFVNKDIYLDLNINAPNADFKQLYSMVPYAYVKDYDKADFEGTGSVKAEVKGTLSEDGSLLPSYNVNVELNNGMVKYSTLPKSISDVNVKARIFNTTGNINDLEIDVPIFKLNIGEDRISGRINSKGMGNRQKVDLALQGALNLKNWKESFPIENINKLNGKIEMDVLLKSDLLSISNKKWSDVIFKGVINAEDIMIENSDSETIAVKFAQASADPKEFSMNMQSLNYLGSDADIQASFQEPLLYLTGGLVKGKIDIKSKKINTDDFLMSSEKTSGGEIIQSSIPNIDLELSFSADQVLSKQYTGKIIDAKGRITQNSLIIYDLNSIINYNNLNIKGELNDLDKYLSGGNLKGFLNLSGTTLNINDFIVPTTDPSASGAAAFTLPKDIDIELKGNATQVKYGNWNLMDAQLAASLSEGSLIIEEMKSRSLGGFLIAQGMYSDLENGKSKFNFKVDLTNIGFQDAIASVKTFEYLAPIAAYMSGYFNSTLVIDSELNNDLSPVFSTLNASGFIETKEGRIQKFNPLTQLSQKLGVEKISDWALTNTRNWFEIVDGMVQLKDYSFDLGNNISLKIGGKHGLGKNMDYHLLFEIPREYLRTNKITGNIEAGISILEKEASKIGINLDQGDFLLLDVHMTGNIKRPQYAIKPIGSSGKKLEDMARDELEKKKLEFQENLSKTVEETKKNVADSLNKKKEEVLDTITRKVDKEVQKARDSLSAVVNTKSQEVLDSLKSKAGLDSTSSKVIDIISNKSGKEIDDIKKKLEKWDPLKKKKKTTGGQ
jgi:hypothetical protein